MTRFAPIKPCTPPRLPELCGIALNAFARAPSPSELARIVATMDSDQQADFFLELALWLEHECGMRADFQIEYIADAIREFGIESHEGARFIRKLAERLEPPLKTSPAAGMNKG